jgi:acyl-CoA synthetase (AMP-forming)/AMP-acid ligase II
MNIVDPILFQCRRQPPAAAICVPGAGIGLISYRRLEQFVHNITRRLLALGLPRQGVVAIDVEDVIFHTTFLLALTRLGMITVSMRDGKNAMPFKVDALITDSNVSLAGQDRAVFADLSWTEGDGRPVEPHLLPATHEDDLCRIILTSGTTNKPKGVALSHKMLAARMSRHLTVFGNRLGNCSRIYSDVPLSSSLGFQFLIYALWRGGTAFFPGKDFASTLPALEQYKVQCMVGSPGGFENLLRWFDTVPQYQSGIEVMLCAGDVLSAVLSNRLRSRICSHLVTFYGATEASMSATAHAHEVAAAPRAVGYVTPDVVMQIVDAAGAILSPGQEGYVRLKSAFAVDRYFRDADESAKVFRDDWFYPGDLGSLSEDGLLLISGREQAVLNVGGDKVSPEAIEGVLLQFKGVAEAAVFVAANEYGNNEIAAAVVGLEQLDEQALRAHCAAKFSPAFTPAKIHIVESLPHNEMGKLDRARLKEWLKLNGGRSA